MDSRLKEKSSLSFLNCRNLCFWLQSRRQTGETLSLVPGVEIWNHHTHTHTQTQQLTVSAQYRHRISICFELFKWNYIIRTSILGHQHFTCTGAAWSCKLVPSRSWCTIFVLMLIPEDFLNCVKYVPQQLATPLFNFTLSSTWWLSFTLP